MKAALQGNPIFLTDTVTITPGNTSTPNIANLTNPNRRAMYIDEINFSIVSNLISGLSANPAWYGAVVRAQIMFGPFELSRSFVPIWTLAQPTDTRNEGWTNVGVENPANAAQFYRWVLPTPLYIPPNVPIIPKLLFHNAETVSTFTSMAVSVGVRGRELLVAEPGNQVRQVPFAGIFLKDGLSVSAFDQISDDKSLVNEFLDRPLSIHRFCFRAYTPDGTDVGEITSDCNLQIIDSQLNDVIGTVLSARGSMGFYNRTWTVPGVTLNSGDYYTARVKLNTALSSNSSSAGFALAMIGTRQEVYGG